MDVRTTHRDLLQRIIARTLRRGGDFAEVYVEDREGLGLRLEDGRIEATSGGREAGAAVRLLTGERTYYAYSDGVDEAALTAAADAVAAAMSGGGAGPSVIMLGDVRSAPHKHPVKVPRSRSSSRARPSCCGQATTPLDQPARRSLRPPSATAIVGDGS